MKTKGLGLAMIKQEGTSVDTITGERVMYELSRYVNEIEIVRVARLSAKTITIIWGEYKRRERFYDWKFFNSWHEAHTALLKRIRGNIEYGIAQLAAERVALRRAKKMKEPGVKRTRTKGY